MYWSLKELYESFECNEYQSDLKKIDELIVEFTTWSETLDQKDLSDEQKMIDFVRYMEVISTLLTKTSAFASLTNATDANNETSLAMLNKLTVASSQLTQPSVRFQKFLKECVEFDLILTQSETLAPYRFFLSQIKVRADKMLSEKEEVLIAKMSMTGSTAWSNLQNKLSSNLLVDIELDGELKSLPLPAVRNLAYHKDADVRRRGYEAEMTAYRKIEESSAAALNGIKGEVNTLVQIRGYENALEETLEKSRMNAEILDAMFTAIKEVLPEFRKYYRRKGELLGHTKGLPFYDMFAPVKEVKLEMEYEEAMKFIIEQFKTFSSRLSDFTQYAYDHQWLDVVPRSGKRGGAFCSNLHAIRESRILSNYNGSFSNLTTLAHELGHAYHGYNLIDESILNSRYPMPIAETASIFCETIVVNAAMKKVSDEEKMAILEASISDAGQVIVDIYSRFVFESALFDKRKDTVLSVNDLKQLMIMTQKEAYGDGLDNDVLHPYMWINKPHYYSAGLNFYNFPYAFGLLFAKGLYAQYLVEGESFVKKYDDLLNATGKELIADVAKRVNIDVTKPDFFRQSLDLIVKDIHQFIQLSK